MGSGCSLLKEELVEVFTGGSQDRFVRAVLLSFDEQRDVTELVVETLLVEFVQHRLAVFGQELIHLTLTVHLESTNTSTHAHSFVPSSNGQLYIYACVFVM